MAQSASGTPRRQAEGREPPTDDRAMDNLLGTFDDIRDSPSLSKPFARSPRQPREHGNGAHQTGGASQAQNEGGRAGKHTRRQSRPHGNNEHPYVESQSLINTIIFNSSAGPRGTGDRARLANRAPERTPEQTPATPTQASESKPGFFRRVFRSSKPSDSPVAQDEAKEPEAESPTKTASTPQSPTQNRMTGRSQAEESMSLNKKSSFFRRRRKDATDMPHAGHLSTNNLHDPSFYTPNQFPNSPMQRSQETLAIAENMDSPKTSVLAENDQARKRFMEQFDFKDKGILTAIRELCFKINLKGETSHLDNIVTAMSERWCACNESHGFVTTEVVHTIAYSILLLNTDLHSVDVEHKMTRAQFVKNTMSAITSLLGSQYAEEEPPRSDSRLSVRRSFRPVSELSQNSYLPSDYKLSENALTSVPPDLDPKIRLLQYESLLKDVYLSINRQPLNLVNEEQPNKGNLARRSSTRMSSHSDGLRLRSSESALSHRWPRPYAASSMTSSNVSLNGMMPQSPRSRSAFGKHSGLSTDSLGSCTSDVRYQQSIGFANALSHAIIKEESGDVPEDEEESRAYWLADDSLELHGAPWAKEGMVKHKYHLEAKGRKAKDRSWNELFSVVGKGSLKLFSFDSSGKNKAQDDVVGGGNWMNNANLKMSITLRQTMANALPAPGYSKSRPHVAALSLPTGAVHLFQVGTSDILKEFVSTINYWSARMSKEPLSSGVSNIEYGWSPQLLRDAEHDQIRSPSISSNVSSPSRKTSHVRSPSGRGNRLGPEGQRAVVISDWTPPSQSGMPSTLVEAEQLASLKAYVGRVENELNIHNSLRNRILNAFPPKSSMLTKAMSNWEAKSSHLLREIVKFRIYIDTLQNAAVKADTVLAR